MIFIQQDFEYYFDTNYIFTVVGFMPGCTKMKADLIFQTFTKKWKFRK